MTVRALVLAGITGLSIGCTGTAADDKGDTGSAVDDTGGGGSGNLWRPSGSGVAYFLDGSEGNSLFHLEMTRCTEPAEGEAYYGWVSRGGADPIALGEIPCSNEEVYFEADLGTNAIVAGYDTFEAWATDDGGATRGAGTALWGGQVNPIIYGVIQDLLIESDATPDGAGSLRSVKTTVEGHRAFAQATLDAPFDMDTFQSASESLANAIEGTAEDRNDDGTVDTIDGQMGILDDDGYIELILADLAEASAQVDPGDPIKDYANYAYDCTQAIETHAYYASIAADVGAVCLAEESCDSRMEDVVASLDSALLGFDANEDGTIDALTEGTIDCAVTYVSEMAQIPVEVP